MIHTSKQLKDKVRNISKGDNEVAKALIRIFMMERFLERVSLSKYKGNNIEIVKVMRRNVLGQMDVNKHFDRLVQMVSEGFADGILIANMQFISKDIDTVFI